MTDYERQLRKELEDNLSLCQTETERGLCRVICEKEIREKLAARAYAKELLKPVFSRMGKDNLRRGYYVNN